MDGVKSLDQLIPKDVWGLILVHFSLKDVAHLRGVSSGFRRLIQTLFPNFSQYETLREFVRSCFPATLNFFSSWISSLQVAESTNFTVIGWSDSRNLAETAPLCWPVLPETRTFKFLFQGKDEPELWQNLDAALEKSRVVVLTCNGWNTTVGLRLHPSFSLLLTRINPLFSRNTCKKWGMFWENTV